MKLLVAFALFAGSLGAATVNCTNTSGDVSAIQSAVNGGGTVTINGPCQAQSTVQINNSVSINGNATLTGNGAIDSGNTILSINSDNVSITGLTFTRGQGISITGTFHSNISITYCTFTYTNGSDGIDAGSFLETSTISHNNFDHVIRDSFINTNCQTWYNDPMHHDCDLAHGTGIVEYTGIDKTAIEYNSCDNIVIECMHLAWDGLLNTADTPYIGFLNPAYGNIAFTGTTGNSISYNSIRLTHRIGMEIQGNTNSNSNPDGSYGCKTTPPAAPSPAGCSYLTTASNQTHMAGNYYRSPWQAYYDTYCNSWVDSQLNVNYVNNTCVFDAAHSTDSGDGGPGQYQEVESTNPNYQGNVYIGQYFGTANNIAMFLIEPTLQSFTAQNNVIAYTGNPLTFPPNCNSSNNLAAWNGCYTPTIVTTYNYLSATAPSLSGSSDITTPYISVTALSNSTSGNTQTFNIGVLSQLGIANVQWFLDSASTPFATQEIVDLSTTFGSDRTFHYHGALNIAGLSSGSHSIKTIATDVSGYSQSVTQTIMGSGGVAPQVTLSPTSLAFGAINTGSASAAQNVTLSNSGSASLTITSIGFTGTNAADFSKSTTCGGTLAVNATCTVSVTFTPGAAGSRAASLSFVTNAADSPEGVALTGSGVSTTCIGSIIANCDFTSGQAPWSLAGTSNASWSVVNNGPSGQAAANISIANTPALGNNIELYQDGLTYGANGTNYTLTFMAKASRSQAIQIYGLNSTSFTGYGLNYAPTLTTSWATYSTTFSTTNTPVAGGGRYTTQLPFAQASDLIQITPITLVVTTASTPIFSATPSSLTFGTTLAGTSSPSQVITITNTGSASLTISSQTISGTNASEFSKSTTCGGTLAASASCTVSVTFSPVTVGTKNAVLTFVDNAGTSPQTFALAGTSGSLLTPGIYSISQSSGSASFCFDAGFLQFPPNAQLKIFTCNMTNAYQQWNVTAVSGGLKLCNVAASALTTYNCLSDISGSPQYGGTPGSSDVWVIANSSGSWTIMNLTTGNYIQSPVLADSSLVSTGATAANWTFSGTSQSNPVVFTPVSPVAQAGQSIVINANQPTNFSLTGAGTCTGCGVNGATSITYTAPSGVVAQHSMLGCPATPNDSVFNTRIDGMPINANSSTWITNSSALAFTFQPSWGISYTDGSTLTRIFKGYYTSATYNLPWPAWNDMKRENGNIVGSLGFGSGSPTRGNPDHHVMAVNRVPCQFSDTYNDLLGTATETCQDSTTGCNVTSVLSYSGLAYSAGVGTDAAGLPLAPLTPTLSEFKSGVINHVLRFTSNYIQGSPSGSPLLWPAQTSNGCATCTTLPIIGARIRLKSSYSITGFSAGAQVFLTALKNYGAILADIGTNNAITVGSDLTTDAAAVSAMTEIAAANITSNMEFIDESSLEVASASWQTCPFGSTCLGPAQTYVNPVSQAILSASGVSTPIIIQPVSIGSKLNTDLTVMAGSYSWTPLTWVNGSTNQSVTWSLGVPLGGGTSVGSIVSNAYVPGSTLGIAVLHGIAAADSAATIDFYLTVVAAGTIRLDTASAANTTDGNGFTWLGGLQPEGTTLTATNDNYPGWTVSPYPGAPYTTQYQSLYYTYGNDLVYPNLIVPNGNYDVSFLLGMLNQCGTLVCGSYPTTQTNPPQGISSIYRYVPFALEGQNQYGYYLYDWMQPVGYLSQVASPIVTIPVPVTNNSLYFAVRSMSFDSTPFYTPGLDASSNPYGKNTLLSGAIVAADTGMPRWTIDTLGQNTISPGTSLSPFRVVDWFTGDSDIASPVWSLVGPVGASISQSGSVTLAAGTYFSGQPLVVTATGAHHSAKVMVYTTGGTGFILKAH